jgi:hypothetical protein
MKNRARLLVYTNAIIVVAVAVYFFVLPTIILVQAIVDPGLRTGEMPRSMFRLHRSLSRKMEPWARNRVTSRQAIHVSTYDISGTEWPIFGSVFYLWATEALQERYEEDPSLSRSEPAQYARGAIEAVTALIADPNHAAWVKDHWGEDYLKREDLFYRMLLISGLTSYQKLSGDDAYQALLLEQVETLANEIDQSPYGLLDDYPGQCYPVDVLPAIAAIRRADEVLGTDHTAFAARALRAFEGARLDPETDLPAYVADSRTGVGYGSARGVGLSFMLTWAPELWPETARQWYERYDEQFWQEGWLVEGFRELPKKNQVPSIWFDVDAGPVLAGYGTAANAFGIGAARANGRFEQAYSLSAEALVASWPLPDGTLLVPRLLSNLSDAPYVGESALLFSLTRQPIVSTGGSASSLPFIVFLALGIYAGLGIAGMSVGITRVVKLEKGFRYNKINVSNQKFGIWLTLMGLGIIAWFISWEMMGGLLILFAVLFPWNR